MSFDKPVIMCVEAVCNDENLKRAYIEVIPNYKAGIWEPGKNKEPIHIGVIIPYRVSRITEGESKLPNPGYPHHSNKMTKEMELEVRLRGEENAVENAISYFSGRDYDFLLIEPQNVKYSAPMDLGHAVSHFIGKVTINALPMILI
jgi:hypothetical protein